ncbi:alpha/beta fold hydrolase [Actinosynnema sp. NPDC023587]|uniref:thioesterase II family protein n=1 Tax=Actinosynnema sp. NPDC023587 TaxID=3154695 RepID=UPI0033CEDACF
MDRPAAVVRAAVGVIRRRLAPSLWQFGGGTPRVVLAPFGGGSAYSVADWLPHVADAAVVVQYPGRGPRAAEPHATSLVGLAEEVAGDLVRHTAGPLVLVGHSVGGVLCHEVARVLEERGREVAHLVVSAARPPHLTLLREAEVLAMDRDAWLGELAGNGFDLPEVVSSPETVDMVVPVLRADYLVLARHARSTGPVRAPLLAVGGDADPWVGEEHLTAWGELTTGPFATAVLPGDHFYYRDDPAAFGAVVRTGCAR